MAGLFAIQVDMENNSERWWDALREREPAIAKKLCQAGVGEPVVVDQYTLARLQALPGWSGDGPAYAEHPLVVNSVILD